MRNISPKLRLLSQSCANFIMLSRDNRTDRLTDGHCQIDLESYQDLEYILGPQTNILTSYQGKDKLIILIFSGYKNIVEFFKIFVVFTVVFTGIIYIKGINYIMVRAIKNKLYVSRISLMQIFDLNFNFTKYWILI